MEKEGFTAVELREHLKDVQEFQELIEIKVNCETMKKYYLFSGNQRFNVILKKNEIYNEIPILIKFASMSVINRERFAIQTKFRKECYFYSQLLPNIANKIGMPQLTDLFPKCYYSFGNAPREFLALRDISPDGFHSIEKPLNVNLGTLVSALTALAKFHAAGIVFKWNHSQEFNQVSLKFNVDQNIYNYFQQSWVDELKDRGINAARKAGIDISKDFENKLYRIVLKFSKCIKETSPWYTIAHGDAVITNFLFNDTKAKLLDLQMLCCASVSYDLVSLISISTEKMFRDTHLDYLLAHYHRQLTYNISQVTNLSKDELKKRGLQFKSLKRDFQLHIPFAYRICSYFLGILIDGNTIQEKFGSQAYTEDAFLKSIKDLHLGGHVVDRLLMEIVKEIIDANVVDELYETF